MMDVEHRCQQIEELLPWFVNRSLRGREAERVRSHLENCERCRDEAEWLARVGSHLRDVEWKPATEASYAGLRERIADDTNRRQPAYFAMAAGLMLAFAVTLGVIVAWQPLAPRYQTVTDAVPAATNTVILQLELAPEAPVRSLYGILERHDAVIVAGPDAQGRVQLEFRLSENDSAARLIDELREDSQVTAVQRAGGGSFRE